MTSFGVRLRDARRKPAGMAAAMLGAAALLCAASGPAFAQESRFSAERLTDSVLVVSGPDGNVVVGVQPNGLVLVDGGTEANAEALLDFIRTETGADRVSTLINTNWRPDRAGANAALGAAGAEIVAHANTHQWLKYGTEHRADGVTYAPAPEAALPTTLLYDDGGTIPFGEGEIEIGYLRQAHTDGDIYAYFAGEDVLAAGGVVRSDSWVMQDWWTGGYLGALLDSYQALLRVAGEETRIVPASGPVMSRADLQAQFDMYTEIYDRLRVLLLAASSPAESVAARPTGEFHPDWADADTFTERAHRSYYAHFRGNRRLGSIP